MSASSSTSRGDNCVADVGDSVGDSRRRRQRPLEPAAANHIDADAKRTRRLRVSDDNDVDHDDKDNFIDTTTSSAVPIDVDIDADVGTPAPPPATSPPPTRKFFEPPQSLLTPVVQDLHNHPSPLNVSPNVPLGAAKELISFSQLAPPPTHTFAHLAMPLSLKPLEDAALDTAQRRSSLLPETETKALSLRVISCVLEMVLPLKESMSPVIACALLVLSVVALVKCNNESVDLVVWAGVLGVARTGGCWPHSWRP